jgi:hypothetical protein
VILVDPGAITSWFFHTAQADLEFPKAASGRAGGRRRFRDQQQSLPPQGW